MSEENNKQSISSLFINRPVMTVLLSLAALVFGIFTYKSMPVNDLPGVDYPVIQVTVSYPGADPTIMGANVASPLEQQFMQIPGIELVTSRNSFGATQVVLQFSMNKSIDAAATDVQSAIQRAMGNLPSDLPSPPSFSKDNPNDEPIYVIAVMSKNYTSGDLYDYAFSEVSQRISMVEGVSKVDVYGAPRSVRRRQACKLRLQHKRFAKRAFALYKHDGCRQSKRAVFAVCAIPEHPVVYRKRLRKFGCRLQKRGSHFPFGNCKGRKRNTV